MKFLKLEYSEIDFHEFVDFWSDFYINSKIEKGYDDRINNAKFIQEDIEKLFEWKNGMAVNGHIQKQASIEKVISKLEYLNELKANFNLEGFNSHFSKTSAIWQIFILHIIQPTEFPIFDQHVYRAHNFLANNIIQEIPNANRVKLEYYHKIYLPFFRKMKFGATDLKKIDMALWAFGKFLKTNYASKLVNRNFLPSP